jgi:malate synthase
MRSTPPGREAFPSVPPGGQPPDRARPGGAPHLSISGEVTGSFEGILSPAALEFVATLANRFGSRRDELLRERLRFHERINEGILPDFLPETRPIREGDWTVAPIPPDLRDRRVEITGPVDRKMVINALNSGANVFMADFEDSHSPTWEGTVQGQVNLRDAVRGTIEYTSPEGKHYRLNESTAVLMVRPRGWHLDEAHMLVDGRPVPASLFDFALFFFHNARQLVARGTGPYFYLPKIEHYREARLWNDVFVAAEELLALPRGTIRATILIETLPAVFELHEILHELREHSAGLNCGRWDYIFSFIKQFRDDPKALFPDRGLVTMASPSLRAYAQLVIQACHRRGIHAIGGMAAQIPIKDDPDANAAAIAKVVADKEREVQDGHDGTWVAHPGLVPVAKRVFDEHMPSANQIHRLRDDVHVTRTELLKIPKGPITETGLRTNVNVGLRYLESWLRGTGCVPINHLMEDTATVEISRMQVWQWIRHGARMEDGRTVTADLVRKVLKDEVDDILANPGEAGARETSVRKAAAILEDVVTTPEFVEFLTLRAYPALDVGTASVAR